MNRNTHESGQIVLLVLLVVVFGVAVSLSLIGRTTENVAISTQLADSAKALSAAEAGLELAMRANTSLTGEVSIGSGEFYDVQMATIGNVATYQLSEKTSKGQLAVLWLNTHTAGLLDETSTGVYPGATIDICWSTTGQPGLIVSLLYKRGAAYLVGKGAYGPISAGRSDSFTNVDAEGSGCGVGSGVYRKTITFSDLGVIPSDIRLALRMRPVYSDAQFYAQGSVAFPPQGNTYTATGTVEETTRRVQVDQVFSAPSSLFDYVIYSQQGDFVQ